MWGLEKNKPLTQVHSTSPFNQIHPNFPLITALSSNAKYTRKAPEGSKEARKSPSGAALSSAQLVTAVQNQPLYRHLTADARLRERSEIRMAAPVVWIRCCAVSKNHVIAPFYCHFLMRAPHSFLPLAKLLMPTPLPQSSPCPHHSASFPAALTFLKGAVGGCSAIHFVDWPTSCCYFLRVRSDGASVSCLALRRIRRLQKRRMLPGSRLLSGAFPPSP